MFQKYAGITYKSYLQNIRLEYAMKDLKGGKYNVTETALRSGFSGSKAMARAFRKKYGILPSEYRENGVAFWRLASDNSYRKWNI